MYNHGWYKVAFEQELENDLTPISVGPKKIVLAKTAQGIRAFDAYCPHRGAHLAYGGQLDGDSVICPFHRYRIGIGAKGRGDFQIPEYYTLVVDGIIFLRLSDFHDNGFEAFITRLVEDHTLLPGFTMEIKCSPELIIENGFDNTHFQPVHGVAADKFLPEVDKNGTLSITSAFYPQGRHGDGASVDVPLQLNAFSPYLSVAQLGGRLPQVFITSANPISEGMSLLRFSLALSKKTYGDPPPEATIERMLAGNKRGIEPDVVIWEHMSMTSPRNLTAQDVAVVEFQKFCERFR